MLSTDETGKMIETLRLVLVMLIGKKLFCVSSVVVFIKCYCSVVGRFLDFWGLYLCSTVVSLYKGTLERAWSHEGQLIMG